MSDGTEVVLFVDKREGLDEHEDKGVTETGEQGQGEDDGFGEEHLEGADPGDNDLFEGESLLKGRDLVGSVKVGVCAVLASLLRDFVHHDGDSGLGHEEEMSGLNGDAEDKLVLVSKAQ